MKLRYRVLCLLLCIALLPLTALHPAKAADNDPAPTIRVQLKRLGLTDRVDMILDGVYVARTGNGLEMAFQRGSEITVQIRDGRLYLFYEGMSLSAGQSLRLTRYASATLAYDGIRFEKGGNYYPGDLLLTITGGVLQPVLTIGVEDYLLGVVPYEMSNSFPLEALKAQAVCARTYALSHVNMQAAWDMVDTTNDQVFKGVDRTQTNAVKAVEATVGIVGMYNGQLATCYYSASNGGQTELVENVWSGRGDWAYYTMVDDPYDLENPESIVRRARLNKDASGLSAAVTTVLCNYLAGTMVRLGYEPDPAHFRVDSLMAVTLGGQPFEAPSRLVDEVTVTLTWSGKKILKDNGNAEDDFSMADVLNAAGIVTAAAPADQLQDAEAEEGEEELRLSGFIAAPGSYEVTIPLFPELIRALNLSISGTDNEMVTLTETETAFILEARRFGHGVGMSQRGAQWMAGQYNKQFHEILGFYYPGMTLAVAPSGSQQPAAAEPNLINTPGPPATPTPRPTLMPVTQTLPTGAYLASVEGIDDDSSLNLRSEPTLAGDILMRLYKHQRLQVLEVCEDPAWVHVRTDSAEGYVMLSFLERVEDAAAPTPGVAQGTPEPTPEG